MNIKEYVFPAKEINPEPASTDQINAKPPTPKPSLDKATRDSIDAYLEQQLQRLSTPGAALAIVEGDQIVYQRGFGRARPEGEPPAPQTPFFIGSLTKSITALAVMQLVEAGKVELDAPVQRYLPWFRVADAQASALILVRHLLNQTSGLSMLSGMPTLADFDSRPDATERQARALSKQKLSHPVGQVWDYCNLNYNLLGLIIEAASGEAYTDYVQNHIFNPLGMGHTYTSKEAARQNGLAVGHRYWFGIPIAAPDLPVPRGAMPSGQLISTTEDMAHYLIAHLNGGRYGDAQILSEAGIHELHRGAAGYRSLSGQAGKYAMGWFDDTYYGTRILSHGGNVADFSAYMGLIPEQKKGMVLLVNADHYGLPPILAEVGFAATTLLAGKPPAPIQLGFVPWVMRSLALIPLLQIVDVVATLRLVRRWRRDPALRPSRLGARHILPSLIPNLLAAFMLIPMTSKLRGYLKLYNPDFAWIALICGSFGRIWTSLRTSWITQTVKKPRASKTDSGT